MSMQWSMVCCSTMQRYVVWCSAAMCDAIPCVAVQCSNEQCGALQCSAVQLRDVLTLHIVYAVKASHQSALDVMRLDAMCGVKKAQHSTALFQRRNLHLPILPSHRRYQLRGAQHVIFYSLPEYAHFYSEIVNSLGDSGEGLGSDISCLVLFTQYERMALERMVGAKRCAHILSSAKTTFMFC